MSQKEQGSSSALIAAGLVAAGVLAARGAQAQSTTPAPVTLYFATAPAANGETQVQIPQTATKFTTASVDVQVVNFALAVETLEAELYRQCLARLTTGGTTDGLGAAITGLGLTTDELDVRFVTEFIQVEQAQRDFLATTLYGSAAANPFLPTGSAYKYAFNTGDPNPVQGVGSFTREQTIQALYTSELRGIAGYLGGSQVLSVGSPFLKVAAAALGVEARHASSLAIALTRLGITTETAPLPGQNGGRDVALTADQLLNGNGTFAAPSVPGGVLPVVSGPKGYVYQ